jgi:hypothetical protein
LGDEQAPVVNYSGTVSQTTLYSLKAVATMEDDNGKINRDFHLIGLYQLLLIIDCLSKTKHCMGLLKVALCC